MYTRRFDDRSVPPSGYSGSFIREPEPELEAHVCEEERDCGCTPPPEPPPCKPSEEPRKGGLLSGLLSKLSLELDDLLLIGLLLLLLGEREDGDSDELLIILAILLISGFN